MEVTGKMPIDLPGVDGALRDEVEGRIEEFEREHEPDVMRDGPGWVPRVRGVDYAIAITINLIVVIWLIVVLVRG